MHKTHNVTFSLFPNSRGFGYACLENPRELIDYGIANISPLCNRKLLQRAKNFIDYYQPTLLLLRDYQSEYAKYSKRTKSLIESIVAYGIEKKVPVEQYSREQIKEVFGTFEANTKYEIAQVIAKEFPPLRHRAPQIRKTWENEDYNMGIFDAVALALTHYYLKD